MSNTAKDALKLVEKELLKFSSYESVKSILSKYSIGQYDEALVEKLLVILSTEFRHKIEKMSVNLPDDDVEAAAIISRRASSTRGASKKTSGIDIEVAEDFDINDFDED